MDYYIFFQKGYSMDKYDIIYIGSGNAAWQGGRFLADAGWNVLIVEEGLAKRW